MARSSCTVTDRDGKQYVVKYSLVKRPETEDRYGDPYWIVRFRDQYGDKKELSTKEASGKRADAAAVIVIQDTYNPKTLVNPTWDYCIGRLKGAMMTANSRPG